MWQFNDQGELKPHAVKHSEYIKNIMLRRGLIFPEDTIAQTGQVHVIGRARSRIRIKESNPFENDSTGVQDFIINFTKRAF